MAVIDKFKDMALSFRGCEGGNLDSTVWICGLEPGREPKGKKISEEEMKPFAEPGAWDANGEIVRDNLKGPYNSKATWFFCYLFGWRISKGSDEYKDECKRHKLFCENGIGFKMNYLPIPFANRVTAKSWGKKLKDLTGFDDFRTYQKWCVEHRGNHFYKLVKDHSPKIIVCTGIGDWCQFARFFRCDPDSTKEYLKNDNPPEHCYAEITNNGDTMVIATPFFGGPNGISSYTKMKMLASQINKYGAEYFNDPNWINH